MINIAIYASGSGTNAENIINYFHNSLNVNVVMVLCNNPEAGVLERAVRLNVPSMVFSKSELPGTLAILKEHSVDLIILAGFLLKIPDEIIDNYKSRIINIHPSLIPNYCGPGMYGHHVHEAVIAAKERESGITIHLVDNQYDHGEILFQAKCPIDAGDTPDDLAAKIHILEQKHFPSVIAEYISSHCQTRV